MHRQHHQTEANVRQQDGQQRAEGGGVLHQAELRTRSTTRQNDGQRSGEVGLFRGVQHHNNPALGDIPKVIRSFIHRVVDILAQQVRCS